MSILVLNFYEGIVSTPIQNVLRHLQQLSHYSSVCIYKSMSSLQLFRKCNKNLEIRGGLSPHLEQINEHLGHAYNST